MRKVIYGVHTGQAKKRITIREANAIKMVFGASISDEHHACSQFFKEGISGFWIEEVTNKEGKQYWMHIKVNFARAMGVGEYGLMPYTIVNMKKAIKAVSKLLKQLKLDGGNADFGEWKWERVDTGFDVEVDYPQLYMLLLDKSLNVKALKRQCKRKHFVPANPNVCESIRFGNASYIYNIYIKIADLINKGIVITPEILQEVANIIRVERQNDLSALKQLLPTGKVKDLASKETMENILKTMIADIEAFWGKGSYYSASEIKAKFGVGLDVEKIVSALGIFTKSSLETEYSQYTPEIKALFQEYGILPTGIRRNDEQWYQISKVKGLYDMVTEYYSVTEKRVYHAFPVPHRCSDGRYKAGITFHQVEDTRKQPVSIAGRTVEEYEQKVWNELKKVFATNLKYHCTHNMSIPDLMQKSADDMMRFSKVLKSKSVKTLIKDDMEKLRVEKFI